MGAPSTNPPNIPTSNGYNFRKTNVLKSRHGDIAATQNFFEDNRARSLNRYSLLYDFM
jgi:hypothetical protein